MKLTLLSAKELTKTLKVTIQSTGRLGFTQITADELKLDSSTSIKFYCDEDRPKEPILHVLHEVGTDDDAYKAIKAGEYYYLPTARLFNKLGFDYNSKPIICDLKEDLEAHDFLAVEMGVDAPTYRLVPRSAKKPRKKQEEENGD